MTDGDFEFDNDAHKAEALDGSIPFSFTLWSDDASVIAATNEIFGRIKPGLPKAINERIHKHQLRVLLLNLHRANLRDEMYVAFGRSKTFYAIPRRYNPSGVSFAVVHLVDAMTECGFIEHVRGFSDRRTGRAKLSRMRASAALSYVLRGTHDIRPEAITIAPNAECIILRDRAPETNRQKAIDYEDNDETNRMRAQLARYNGYLSRADIEVRLPAEGVVGEDGELVTIDPQDRFVRRIFNNGSWNQGGRFYGGWWQRVPKKWRTEIQVGGVPATEVDYSSLHIMLLYAMEGIDYAKEIGTDAYQLEGYANSEEMRDFLKLVLITALNAGTPEKAKAAIQKEVNFKKATWSWIGSMGLEVAAIIDAFAARHEPIRKYLFSGVGLELQYADSRMAEHVISTMMDEEIPVLCIHDSFVVATDKLPHLKAVMKDAFLRATAELSKGKVSFAPKMKELGIGEDAWKDFEWFRANFDLKEYNEMLRMTGQLSDGRDL
jgi:hypothetical protein